MSEDNKIDDVLDTLDGNPPPKICKNCKFYFNDTNSTEYAACTRKANPRDVDLVSGKASTTNYLNCKIERRYTSSEHVCGFDGKFYEPKEKSKPEPKPIHERTLFDWLFGK